MDIEKSILKRIQKLLALAKDKGASPAEAESAMAMAQRLMTKYGIEMANISDDSPKSSIKHEAFFTRKGSFNPADNLIMNLLMHYYKVRILFSNNRYDRDIIIVGTPENVEIAKYVHGYLRNVFFRCWNEYKKTTYGANRTSFYRGLWFGIDQRMEEAEKQAKAEESSDAVQKYELVLVNEKAAISNYISEMFGPLKRNRERMGVANSRDFMAGKAKGATVQINQAIKA